MITNLINEQTTNYLHINTYYCADYPQDNIPDFQEYIFRQICQIQNGAYLAFTKSVRYTYFYG